MIIIIIAVMSIARYFNDKAEHTVLYKINRTCLSIIQVETSKIIYRHSKVFLAHMTHTHARTHARTQAGRQARTHARHAHTHTPLALTGVALVDRVRLLNHTVTSVNVCRRVCSPAIMFPYLSYLTRRAVYFLHFNKGNPGHRLVGVYQLGLALQ